MVVHIASNLEFVKVTNFLLPRTKESLFLFFPLKILILPKQRMKITASLLKDRFIGDLVHRRELALVDLSMEVDSRIGRRLSNHRCNDRWSTEERHRRSTKQTFVTLCLYEPWTGEVKEGGGGAADQVESNRVTYELRNAPVLVFNMQHRWIVSGARILDEPANFASQLYFPRVGKWFIRIKLLKIIDDRMKRGKMKKFFILWMKTNLKK